MPQGFVSRGALLRRASVLVLSAVVACGGSSANPSDVSEDAAAGTQDDDGGLPDTSSTQLSGSLGTLGDVQPMVSTFFIKNSGETIVYMSSDELTCQLLMREGGRWLGMLKPGSQVVEIVAKGTPKLGTVSVDNVEINYAPGGKSSNYEKNAHSGSVTFTMSTPDVLEGVVMATYANPQGAVSGTFHAEFCAGGQEY